MRDYIFPVIFILFLFSLSSCVSKARYQRDLETTHATAHIEDQLEIFDLRYELNKCQKGKSVKVSQVKTNSTGIKTNATDGFDKGR